MRKTPLLIAVVIGTVIAAYTSVDEPHEFTEEQCASCHIDTERLPKLLIGPVSGLCVKCHDEILETASHPVDIIPRLTAVPPDLPLSGGQVTCNTCHNVHAQRYTVFRIKSNYLRRAESGKSFCISCHRENPVELSHRQLFDKAHIGKGFVVTDPSQPIDEVSVQCIGCHDGSIGSAADYKIGTGHWNHLEGSHPIGVHYTESRMRGKRLKPLSMLDESIRFFDGRVGCATCHDPFSAAPKQLVMLNRGSALCIECHEDY